MTLCTLAWARGVSCPKRVCTSSSRKSSICFLQSRFDWNWQRIGKKNNIAKAKRPAKFKTEPILKWQFGVEFDIFQFLCVVTSLANNVYLVLMRRDTSESVLNWKDRVGKLIFRLFFAFIPLIGALFISNLVTV